MNALVHGSRPLIAGDTETTLVRRWAPVPDLVVTGWAAGNESGLVHQMDPEAEETAEAIMEGESTWANGPFDWAVYLKKYRKREMKRLIFESIRDGRAHDVLTRAKIIDIASGTYKYRRGKAEHGRGYSLQMCVKRELKHELDKESDTRLRYGELMEIPIELWSPEARLYAEADPCYTLFLHEAEERKRAAVIAADGVDLLEDEFRQVRAKWGLHLASAWGIRVDQEAVKRFEKRVRQMLIVKGDLLVRNGLARFEKGKYVRSTEVARKQMERACGRTGIEPHLTTKGRVSLKEDLCLNSGDELLIAYAELTGMQKLEGAYIKHLKDAGNYPVHCFFEELVDTGRTSAARPNLQQTPRKFEIRGYELDDDEDELIEADDEECTLILPGVKECYIPRPGCLFACCDLDKAELVSFAEVQLQLFGHSALAEALEANIDPHMRVAAKILGITYDEALARKKEEVVVNARNAAKPCNFGFPGGMGPNRFVGYAKAGYGIDVTFEKAIALRQDWKKTWPEVVDYLAYIGNITRCTKCSGTGKLEVLSSLAPGGIEKQECPRCWGKGSATTDVLAVGSNRCRGRVSFTEAANGFFQQLTADAAKHALWCVTWRQYMEPSSALYGTHIVNFIHDEIIVEAPANRAHAAAKELEETMISAVQEWVPHCPKAVRATAHVEDRWRKG